MALFLESIPIAKESAILTEKLANLYSDLGKPSSAIEMFERALELKPSPEQKVRIRLALGEKLAAADRAQDAIEDYAKIIPENPDYPAKAEIYGKLKSLAKKLGRDEAAEAYEQRIKELSASK